MDMHTAFETTRGRRYLGALCHHFGRKVPAQCDAGVGRVHFPFGQCDLRADDTRLELWVSAESQDNLSIIINVMTRHLERFAFRENPDLTWQPTGKAPVK